MKQLLNRVTITGADDSTKREDLLDLSGDYPHVEWGFLLSEHKAGSNRFPSHEWLKEMYSLYASEGYEYMQLSGHVCGKWVREICKANWEGIMGAFGDVNPYNPYHTLSMFERFQLNFHAYVHKILDKEAFAKAMTKGWRWSRDYIFQLDDVNNGILDIAKEHKVEAAPLFDLSGGAGVLPENWPKANGYCGYAGGLSPDNVNDQLELIEQVAGDGPIWIDVESHVRGDDDSVFDMGKVRAFIEAVDPWVIKI